MNNLNQCQFIGNVGKEPEIKQIGENKVAQFSLACSDSYTNKSGEKVESTEWVNIVVWGKLAEIIEKYVKKGDKLYVSGKLQTRSYESNGERKYVTNVNADSMLMLGSKPTGQTTPAQQSPEQPQEIRNVNDSSDNLPF